MGYPAECRRWKIEKSNVSSRVPEWAGRYPFAPEDKRPVLLTEYRMPRLYGRFPHQVPTCLYVSTDRITSSGFQVQPGKWFEPADIHGGTEVYYVRSGEATAIDPETGRTCVVPAGSAVYIPERMWHQTHNFGKDELDIITFFAPKMWVDDIGVEVSYDRAPSTFSGSITDAPYPAPADLGFTLSRPENGIVGSYPCSARSALQAGRMFSVSPCEALRAVHGQKSRALVSLFVANEVISVGTVHVPPGTVTDPERHGGDEVLCVLSGELSLAVHESDQSAASVSVPRHEIREGERFLVPEGFSHSYYNSSNETVVALFAVAPQL